MYAALLRDTPGTTSYTFAGQRLHQRRRRRLDSSLHTLQS